MAILIIHTPGQPHGPCREKCTHPHCWHLKQEADSRCAACGSNIGYNRSYIRLTTGEAYHTDCLNNQVEQRR